MIGALIWIVETIRRLRTARKRDRSLARVILAMKRERYDLNPAFRVRTRIPKITGPL